MKRAGTIENCLLALLAMTPLLVSAATDNATYYQHGREGWHFYDDPPPETDPPEPKQSSPKKPPETTSTEKPPKDTDQAKPMSVQWIRKHIKEFRDRAINNPTRENVRAYLYLQKAAMDKASRFSQVSSEVTVGDPYLDEKVRRPTATYAVNASQKRAKDATDRTLKELGQKDNVGLLFIFSSDCPYCRTQAPVLKRFGQLYGLPIRAVSIDGHHMPGKPFPDASYDPSLAERLGVSKTPATFLVRPPGGMSPLAQGVLSLEELRKRSIVVAQREGWISRETYEATTGVNPVDPDTAITPGGGGDPAESPQDLLRYIRQQTKGEL